MSSQNRIRFTHWKLPLSPSTIKEVLKEYNDRPTWNGNPADSTWPSTRFSCTKKKDYKELTSLIVKFKRRERWELLKAELGPVYLENLHKKETCEGENKKRWKKLFPSMILE